MEARNQCELHGAIVVVERLNCFLVLSNAGCSQRFHRPNHTFEIPAPSIFRRRLSNVPLMRSLGRGCGLSSGFGCGVGFGFAGFGLGAGWNGASARVASSRIVFRSVSLNLSADVSRPLRPPDVRRRFLYCLLASLTFSIALVEQVRRQSQEHGDLLDHRHRLRFRLFETSADALP